MPGLPTLLDAFREKPGDPSRWLAYAQWLDDNGRDNEAAGRCFWPALRDNVTEAGVSLNETLRQLQRYAGLPGRRARELEQRRYGPRG
jgi:uncharacterized protein (TIGR02996 family)